MLESTVEIGVAILGVAGWAMFLCLRGKQLELEDRVRDLEEAKPLPSDEGLRDTPAVDSLILASPLS